MPVTESEWLAMNLLLPVMTPFKSARSYFLFNFILPSVILVTFRIVNCMLKRPTLLLCTFKGMLRIQDQQLHCFDVNVTYEKEIIHIRSNLIDVIRIAIVAVSCLMWEALFSHHVTIANPEISPESNVAVACRAGLACFPLASVRDIFLLVWLFRDLDELCEIHGDQLRDIEAAASGSPMFASNTSLGFVLCLGIKKVNTMSVAIVAAIAFGLFNLLISIYEFAAWFSYSAKSWPIAYLVPGLAAVWVIVLIVLVYATADFFVYTWFSTITFFAFPLIIYKSFRLGRLLNQIRTRHMSEYAYMLSKDKPFLEDRIELDSSRFRHFATTIPTVSSSSILLNDTPPREGPISSPGLAPHPRRRLKTA